VCVCVCVRACMCVCVRVCVCDTHICRAKMKVSKGTLRRVRVLFSILVRSTYVPCADARSNDVACVTFNQTHIDNSIFKSACTHTHTNIRDLMHL